MSVCVYDNPDTMRRESWQDRQLIVAYSASLLCSKSFKGDGNRFFFGSNIGPWKAGQLVGDRGAMLRELNR